MKHRPRKYAVVVNPRSGNGRTGRQWAQIETDVRSEIGDYTLLMTEGPGHATQAVRAALHDGHDRIISAGGDGTAYEVVNGFFDGLDPINSDASLALLPLGTGSDFRRTINLPKGRGAIPYLASDDVIVSDVGRITLRALDGGDRVCHFLNSVHIGVGGRVGEVVNNSSKILGGFLTFLFAVVAARLTFRACQMDVDVDGKTFSLPCLEVIAANGRYDGGGMKVAPRALLDSGHLEVYVIGDLSLTRTILNLHHLYRGTQESLREVIYLTGKHIAVSSPNRVLVSPDGELAGQLPARIEVVPKAIKLVTGPNPPVI